MYNWMYVRQQIEFIFVFVLTEMYEHCLYLREPIYTNLTVCILRGERAPEASEPASAYRALPDILFVVCICKLNMADS